MQYLVVTIRRETDLRRPRMRYPAIYDASDVDSQKRGPIIYEGALALGENTEECLMFVSDRLANAYKTDADMRMLTEVEADTWLAAARNLARIPEEQVTDANRLVAIQAKVAAGVALTAEDNAALNPDDPIAGINRRRKTALGIFG